MSELSKEARALLEAARPAENPAAEDKARVLAALSTKLALPMLDPSAGAGAGTAGAGTAGSAGAGAAGAGVAKVGAGLTAAAKVKIVVAVVATSAAGAGTWKLVDRETPPPAGVVVASKAPSSTPAAPARVAHDNDAHVSLAPPAKTGRRARLADVAPAKPASPASPVDARPRVRRSKPVVAVKSGGDHKAPTDEPGAPSGEASGPPAGTGPGAPAATVLRESPKAPPVKPEPPERPSCDTRSELLMLGQAQAALRAKDGQRALVELGRHGRRCPSPTFGEEARAARVLALCLLERTAEARREAERLRRDAPRSPHLARLRSSCAFSRRR